MVMASSRFYSSKACRELVRPTKSCWMIMWIRKENINIVPVSFGRAFDMTLGAPDSDCACNLRISMGISDLSIF